MEPIEDHLGLRRGRGDRLEWSWVSDQLAAAGTYWVVSQDDLDPEADQWPHPRPVWGVWVDNCLHLSIGSPVIRRQLGRHPDCTVHLESGTDVVIVEGLAISDDTRETLALKAAYDAKYDWDYGIEQYGVFTRVEPDAVMAWRSIGPAGREGFSQAGRWRFPEPEY